MQYNFAQNFSMTMRSKKIEVKENWNWLVRTKNKEFLLSLLLCTELFSPITH